MMALMRESKITREMIEAHLGCRFEWYVNGRQPHSIVFARLWPLPGQSLEEMVACWNEHGWRLAHDYENSTTRERCAHPGPGRPVRQTLRRQATHPPFLAVLGPQVPVRRTLRRQGTHPPFLAVLGPQVPLSMPALVGPSAG